MKTTRNATITRLRKVRRIVVRRAWEARCDYRSNRAAGNLTAREFWDGQFRAFKGVIWLLRIQEGKVQAVREWNALTRYARRSNQEAGVA